MRRWRYKRTCFAEGFSVEQFRKILDRHDIVKEVFLLNKKNCQGRQYGFVCFSGVQNQYLLERELDRICIGNQKIHVNLPKFQRKYAFSNIQKPMLKEFN